MRFLVIAVVAYCSTHQLAQADLIVSTSTGGGFSLLPKSTHIGHLTKVTVGGDDVDVDQIGVFGDPLAPVRMKWLIFNDTDNSNPILETSFALLPAVGGAQWFDSPVFASPFTLQANQTYWIGTAIDATQSESYRARWNLNGPDVTGGGLTLGSINGLTLPSFANPRLLRNGGIVQPTIRIFGPSAQPVPEPPSLALLGVAMVTLLGYRWRRQHAVECSGSTLL